MVLRWAAEPRQWRPAAITLLVLATVAVVSYAAMSPPLSYHAYLKAESLHAFVASLARNLAFPWINSPRRSIVWLPMVAVAILVLARRLRSTPLEQMSLALGAWVVMQAAATAYSRGVGGGAPQSRYLDSLSFGFVANSIAMLALLECGKTRRWRIAMSGATAVWLAIGVVGIAQVSRQMLEKDGRSRSIWMQEYVRNVRHFVMSGDVATLSEKRGPMEVPYPSRKVERLAPPSVRARRSCRPSFVTRRARGSGRGGSSLHSHRVAKGPIAGVGFLRTRAGEVDRPLRERADEM